MIRGGCWAPVAEAGCVIWGGHCHDPVSAGGALVPRWKGRPVGTGLCRGKPSVHPWHSSSLEGMSGTPLPATSPCRLGRPHLFLGEAGRSPFLQEGVFGQPGSVNKLSWLLMMRNCELVRAGWVWGDWVFKAGG